MSVAVGGLQLEGVWPLSCGQHTPGGRPKISRSGPAREQPVQISGRLDSVGGVAAPQWFSEPPYYLFELFALKGFICLAHLGRLLWPPAFGFWRGLLTAGTPSPSPFDKTNSSLDYDSPLSFAVILSSRWGTAGLWVDFRGSSFLTDRADKEVTSARRRTNEVVPRIVTISGGAAVDSGRCHAITG